MYSEFQNHILGCLPELLDGPCIIACSGGIDSVVLVDLCVRLGMDISIAHCNFKLRGDESSEDEKFVSRLAEKHKIKIHVKSFDTKRYASFNKLSIQMAARELRFAWFRELSLQSGDSPVLTAHHADDNLETFLINLSRGTGIKGLSGIPRRSGCIVRPLLNFSRQEIMDYAVEHHMKWREDSSNKEKNYLRNRIRLDIVPQLKNLHPKFLENFKRTQSHLKEVVSLIDHQLFELRPTLFLPYRGGWQIPVESLKKLYPLDTYLYAFFQEYGFTELNNLKELLEASSGKELRSRTHRLIKDRATLILVPIEERKELSFEFKPEEGKIKGPVPMRIDKVSAITEGANDILYVDKETLNQRLQVRKWKKGDYFYPLGMKGRKLVSKFFKDEKLNALQKEDQWLLFSGDKLVWVIGRRADDRFKVGPQTREILRFQLIE